MRVQTVYSPLDLWLSVLKPLGFQWLSDANFYIQSNEEIILDGIQEVGISDTLADIM